MCNFCLHAAVTYQTPNSLDARIYNLSHRARCSSITQEFTRIVLQAGYEGNFGTNLSTARSSRRASVARIRPTTTSSITAADGDEAYNFSTLALSLAAGATPDDSVQGFLQAMARGGVSQWLSA
jgi:hypothetical protein